jgi:hypothetical protein
MCVSWRKVTVPGEASPRTKAIGLGGERDAPPALLEARAERACGMPE